MDISKYRDNVELSDICVLIEGQEFNLHKFPLSINCDYFKNECKNQSKVILEKFPGGKAIFEIIADHCYGKDVELTTENVSIMFCASEMLGMTGKNNLLEKCTKYIDRIFRSSEYSRCIDSVIEFLESSRTLKSESIKIFINRGFTLILQLWLRSLSGFNSNLKEKYIEDLIVYRAILNLDYYYIRKIIKFCTGEESKFSYVAKLIVDYIEILLNGEESESESEVKKNVKVNSKKKSKKNSSGEKFPDELNEECKPEDFSLSDSENLQCISKKLNSKEKSKILDKIIKSLPNEINLGKVVSVDWLQNVLEFCRKYECKSKNKLLQLCGGILTHASAEDLKSMDPKSITEMIEQTLNNDTVDRDLMKWIWDNHFLEMAQNSELDPAVFSKVVKNMPEAHNVDPDMVFKIVLSILNNIGSDGQKYKNDLIDTVDLEKISPENLELAVNSRFWDIEVICKVAIDRLKNKNTYKLSNNYFYKESKNNFNTTLDNQTKSTSYYSNGNKILSHYKSPSYTGYLNTMPSAYDDEVDTTPPEYNYISYPTTKYVYSSYSPDSYLTMEENLKFELKKISESYSDYYKNQLRSRSRRRYPIAHHY